MGKFKRTSSSGKKGSIPHSLPAASSSTRKKTKIFDSFGLLKPLANIGESQDPIYLISPTFVRISL